MTDIRTREGWLDLATVSDSAARWLIGWSMVDPHDATLVLDALHTAAAVCEPRTTPRKIGSA